MTTYTAEEIAEFLVNTYPGPLGNLDPVFKTEAEALAAWEAWVEHMAEFGVGRPSKP